jgi:hypothetical protein
MSSLPASLGSMSRAPAAVAVLPFCGSAIWRWSPRDFGIALVVLCLIVIAGVGRLGINFVRPAKPTPKPEDQTENYKPFT